MIQLFLPNLGAKALSEAKGPGVLLVASKRPMRCMGKAYLQFGADKPLKGRAIGPSPEQTLGGVAAANPVDGSLCISSTMDSNFTRVKKRYLLRRGHFWSKCNQIRLGDGSVNDRKIKNMEEFAEVIGISRPTVSKYFHDPESVRKTTRGKIEAALEEYDYRPNIFAVNQNRKLSKTIGILVPYLADPFFAEIVRKIERRCIEAGFWPVVFSAHGRRDLENNVLSTLRSLRPAGALLAPLGRRSDLGAVQQFAEEVPTVVFDSNVKVGEAFVGSDNFQSIDLIVDYLCRTGEPPCFFEMPPVNPNANKRRDAYTRSMARLGFDPKIVQVEGSGWEFEKIGLEGGIELITNRALPSDTILCSNDRLAVGLIAAAYQKGLRVGHGPGCALRIAGHDDHPWSRFTCPPLTTVSQDYSAIAERSVEILFDLISGTRDLDGRPEILFEGKLVLRESA